MKQERQLWNAIRKRRLNSEAAFYILTLYKLVSFESAVNMLNYYSRQSALLAEPPADDPSSDAREEEIDID